MKLPKIEKEIQKIFSFLHLGTPHMSIHTESDLGIEIIQIEIPKKLPFLEEEFTNALVHILKRIAEHKNPHHNLVFDLDGSQIQRISETKEKARIAYQRVLQYDKPYTFGYLNGFERMIVHSVLKEYPEVETVSEGRGRDRRLKVLKK